MVLTQTRLHVLLGVQTFLIDVNFGFETKKETVLKPRCEFEGKTAW